MSESLNIVVLGDEGVGKTSLIRRFNHYKVSKNASPTIGIEFFFKEYEYNQRKEKFIIWDTAGQEKFRTSTLNYCKRTDGFIICFDLTSRRSLENVRKWLE
eukprot:gene909-9818_t